MLRAIKTYVIISFLTLLKLQRYKYTYLTLSNKIKYGTEIRSEHVQKLWIAYNTYIWGLILRDFGLKKKIKADIFSDLICRKI